MNRCWTSPSGCRIYCSSTTIAGAGNHRRQGIELMPYMYLCCAIVFEVIGTAALKETAGFSRLWPSAVTLTAYGISFWALAMTLKSIPVGLTYAIWSGVGIVLVSAIGWFRYKQSLDTPALIGLGLIISGVVIANAFSKSFSH